MELWDNIVLALVSLRANKMRALLTMLGIIIGIGSVIAIVTVGDSLTGSISSAMQDMGVSNITVSLTTRDDDDDMGNGMQVRMFRMSQPEEEDLMTDEMIAEYREAFGDDIEAITLTESVGTGLIAVDGVDDTVAASITGVNNDYADANSVDMLYGRFVRDDDGEKKLAVVSDYLVTYFFGKGTDGVGKSISVTANGRLYTFYICGVYAYELSDNEKSSSSAISTPIYIPLQTAKKIANADDGYQSFTVVGSVNADSATLLKNTQSFFESYYTRNTSYTVEASNLEDMVDSVTEMLDTVKLAIAAIAAISLLVGGIGVMNIMMVSITERTREIGTRKALGAPGYAIRLQFITESVVICLIGGAIGIALGIAGGAVASNMLGYSAQASLSAILIAFFFSMGIGVFFGYYPANKAAKLDPIEALRYE